MTTDTELRERLESETERANDYRARLRVTRDRAERAEAEVARLRGGIEALADELHRVDAAMLAGGAGPASMSVRDTVRRLRSLLQEGE